MTIRSEQQRETRAIVAALLELIESNGRPFGRAELMQVVGERARQAGLVWPDKSLEERVFARLNIYAGNGRLQVRGFGTARLWAAAWVPPVDLEHARTEHDARMAQKWREAAAAKEAQARERRKQLAEAARREREALLEAGRRAALERQVLAAVTGTSVAQPRRTPFGGTYTHAFEPPARAGAMDHARCKSHGFRC